MVPHISSEGITMRLAWGIVAVLLIFWLLGIGLHVAGSLIHLLLLVAFVVLIIDLLSGRRAA
jgi:Family of unknown function (DUF5670)